MNLEDGGSVSEDGHPAIIKGAPIPPPRTTAGRGRLTRLVREMEIGDSVIFSLEKEAEALRVRLQQMGFGSVKRKVTGGFQVWKVAAVVRTDP